MLGLGIDKLCWHCLWVPNSNKNFLRIIGTFFYRIIVCCVLHIAWCTCVKGVVKGFFFVIELLWISPGKISGRLY